jgi:hypothetical protein
MSHPQNPKIKLAFFYDIDGFFHPYDQVRRNEKRQVIRSSSDGLFAWAHLIKPVLEEFPEMEGFCHSHWRNFCTLDELKEQLPDFLAERTVGMTEPGGDRYKAIVECAKENEITLYLMLDDDPWAFPRGVKNVVIVPSDTGLSAPGAVEKVRNAFAAIRVEAQAMAAQAS